MKGVQRSPQERAAELSPARSALLHELRDRRAGQGHHENEPVPMRSGAGVASDGSGASGGAGPLVLMHPAGGELFCYTPLVRALPPGPAVLGFAADPDQLDLPVQERIPVVASTILRSLSRVADPGRCVLVGWSYGGMLAFELARQHALAGGDLPPVVLLDCSYYGDVQFDAEVTLRARFVYDLARLVGRDHEEVEEALQARASGRRAQQPLEPADVELRAMLEVAQVQVEFGDTELVTRFNTFRACALALQSYQPDSPYAGPVTVVTAGDTLSVVDRWRDVCTGPMRAVELPGDHYTLFTSPVLEQVTEVVVDALRDVAGPVRPTSTNRNGPS